MDHKWSRSWNLLNKLIRKFLLSIFRSETLFGYPVLKDYSCKFLLGSLSHSHTALALSHLASIFTPKFEPKMTDSLAILRAIPISAQERTFSVYAESSLPSKLFTTRDNGFLSRNLNTRSWPSVNAIPENWRRNSLAISSVSCGSAVALEIKNETGLVIIEISAEIWDLRGNIEWLWNRFGKKLHGKFWKEFNKYL